MGPVDTEVDSIRKFVEEEQQADPELTVGHCIRAAVVRLKLTTHNVEQLASQYGMTVKDVLEGP